MRNKLIGVMTICAFAPLANASSYKAHDPFVGIEAIQTNQDFKAGFGKNVFKKNPMAYGVFGGFKFHKHFGAELGYEVQPNKNKRTVLTGGDRIPGSTLPINATATNAMLESSYQTRHVNVGVFGEHKLNLGGADRLKLQALVGFSVSHVKARNALLRVNNVPLSLAQYQSSISTYSKTKVVPMAKVSATYMVTRQIGLKATGMYRNMSAFKVKANEQGSAQIKLKDTWGAGLGVTYNFCK